MWSHAQAANWEVVGCYCQTELGHGSNVRALETTATFLPGTDEIEINTPTVTATKWWPGNLGRTANHAIVYARLIVAGADLGVHNFMVQIRDLDTHRPCPGIHAGDIGPKIGYNNQDNGFCRFDHVRIPRTNMAMKHATLARDGSYTAAASAHASAPSPTPLPTTRGDGPRNGECAANHAGPTWLPPRSTRARRPSSRHQRKNDVSLTARHAACLLFCFK